MIPVAFHPPFVITSYVKVIMHRKALFPTPVNKALLLAADFFFLPDYADYADLTEIFSGILTSGSLIN